MTEPAPSLIWHTAPRAKWVWAVSGCLLVTLLAGGAAMLCVWLCRPLVWALFPLWGGGSYAAFRYAVCRVAADGGTLTAGLLHARRGVWWQAVHTVSLTHLCGVTRWEPPLHRLLGGVTLRIYTLGGTLWLPLLSREEGNALYIALETAL